MTGFDDIIPRPPVVRERLALARREATRLRRLLRLAESAADDRASRSAGTTTPLPERREVRHGR